MRKRKASMPQGKPTLAQISEKLDQLNSTIEAGLAFVEAIRKVSSKPLTDNEADVFDDVLNAIITSNLPQSRTSKMLELLASMKESYIHRK